MNGLKEKNKLFLLRGQPTLLGPYLSLCASCFSFSYVVLSLPFDNHKDKLCSIPVLLKVVFLTNCIEVTN